MTDTLTNLPGRKPFFEELCRRLNARTQRDGLLALLVVDVGPLREINTQIGYHAGDLILAGVADRIRAFLRETDVLARIADTEFGLILSSLVSSGQAELAATRVVSVCMQPFHVLGHQVKVRVKVGIALHPNHATAPERLLCRADIALCQARSTEDAYAFYSDCSSRDLPSVVVIEGELEQAIANSDLEVYFQPKIALKNRMVTGVEALTRWTSQKFGPVRPDVFIGVAERTGLILPLTVFVLNTALRQCQELTRDPGFSVAVNLSAVILGNPEVFELVTQATNIWGFEPAQLTLEVTESALMADPETSLDLLKRLAEYGINVSIDDFGTGYSSLVYLNKLPVSELKVDKSFVMSMLDQERDARIVQAVIDLAHTFELAVVAEGVDRPATVEAVAAMGCDYAQGAHIGWPMPIDLLMDWLVRSPWARESTMRAASGS